MYRLALAAFLGLALLGASAFDADAQNKSGKSSAPAVKSTAPVRQPAADAEPVRASAPAPNRPAQQAARTAFLIVDLLSP